MSRVMKRGVPRFAGADHGVEDGQQLAHAGHEGDLGQFARGDQPFVEGLDYFMSELEMLLSGGRDGGLYMMIGRKR